MRRNLTAGVALLLLGLAFTPFCMGQEEGTSGQAGASLDLPSRDWGISLGNSSRFTGLRINFRDSYLERINGLNLTLWRPRGTPGGEINGIALGLLGPSADRLNGLSVGLLGVVAGERARGVNIGGLSTVSGGSMEGLNYGTFATVAEDNLSGINLAGLAVVSGGTLTKKSPRRPDWPWSATARSGAPTPGD